MKRYGLLNKLNNRLMRVRTQSSNGDACCTDVIYELCDYGDNIWIVNSLSEAKQVLEEEVPWYNADYETPSLSMNSYPDLVPVEIEINFKEIEC